MLCTLEDQQGGQWPKHSERGREVREGSPVRTLDCTQRNGKPLKN